MSQVASQTVSQPTFDSAEPTDAGEKTEVQVELFEEADDQFDDPPLEAEEPADREIWHTPPNIFRPRIWEQNSQAHYVRPPHFEPRPVQLEARSVQLEARPPQLALTVPPPLPVAPVFVRQFVAAPFLAAPPRPHPQMRRPKRPPPRNHYPLGHVAARLFTGVGWLVILAGLALPLALLIPVLAAHYGASTFLGGSAGSVFVGLLIVAMGHAARATLDQANAAREIVAIERARWNSELIYPDLR